MDKNKVIKCFYNILKNVSRDNCSRYMKNHFPNEFKWLMDNTKFLNKFDNGTKNGHISIFERIYCIEHGLNDRPLCSNCKTNYVCGFNKQTNSYRKWCSARCQSSDKSCIEKGKKTKIKKYGNENYNGIEKSAKTRFEKYNSWHKNDFSEKTKMTKLKRYGDEKYVNTSKAKNTKLEKYGNENFNNSEKNKITRKTNFYNNILLKDFNITPLFSMDEYINGDKNTIFKWKCNKCGTIFESCFDYNFKSKIDKEYHVRCMNCFPYKERKDSNLEIEMRNYIQSICNSEISTSDRSFIKPYELDVLVKDKNIAFEFDGLYWHSEINGKTSSYHLMKTNMCLKKGCRLIHIFEDEWNDKNDIVKYRIRNLFGVYDNIVYARKCTINEVGSEECKKFLSKNHIQGWCSSSCSIGLYFNKDLVSIMTFGKSRFSHKYEWELLRFCSKLGFHIPGAAGKLLKYFERNYNPKSLVTYADRRWSVGNVYEKLGFDFIGNSRPNYWYLDNNYLKRYSRILFQKHKLSNILKIYDSSKSEKENMENNGYSRIWDCGNMVFCKIYKN